MTSDPHGAEPVVRAGASLEAAVGAVILLHGRGGSAEDILGLVPAFGAPSLAYLAPRAAGHTWYPNSFLAPRAQNEPWLSSALRKVESVVALALGAGLPLTKIAICGFSQGACLATEFVATHPARYGGLIAYTGGLIGPLGADLHYPGQLEGTPAFFGSGDPDPHVPWARVAQSAGILKGMGAVVTTERYQGRPHTISAKEILAGRLVVQNLLD
jgi:phospholipase/carboxylesterase